MVMTDPADNENETENTTGTENTTKTEAAA
jgi:hypothetical protein